MHVFKGKEETLNGFRKHLSGPFCTCSSESFPDRGLSASYSPAGWCITGEVSKAGLLCMVVAWGLTQVWGPVLASSTCGPHTECWSPPHKDLALIVCPSHPTYCSSWFQANLTRIDCTIDNETSVYALDDLESLYPEFHLYMLVCGSSSQWSSVFSASQHAMVIHAVFIQVLGNRSGAFFL
jgi:hypothetical protein